MLWTWLSVVGEKYRLESRDPSPNLYNLNRVREHWRRGGAEMMVWVLLDGDQAFGYAVTEVSHAHERQCYVAEAWIHPAYRRTEAVRLGLAAFEGWAVAHNCATIKFSTFRSSKAYGRLLRRLGWRQGEAVFCKPLEAPRG